MTFCLPLNPATCLLLWSFTNNHLLRPALETSSPSPIVFITLERISLRVQHSGLWQLSGQGALLQIPPPYNNVQEIYLWISCETSQNKLAACEARGSLGGKAVLFQYDSQHSRAPAILLHLRVRRAVYDAALIQLELQYCWVPILQNGALRKKTRPI
jgi:hypothetical protein